MKWSSFEELLREIYPKILASHQYLYEFRDPHKEGLVYIHHNWESADNSPVWDDPLSRIHLTGARDVSSLRRDLEIADASQRPTNDNYNRYIYLVDLFRKYKYDDKDIFEQCPFLIQDILFNSMLVRSNRDRLCVSFWKIFAHVRDHLFAQIFGQAVEPGDALHRAQPGELALGELACRGNALFT